MESYDVMKKREKKRLNMKILGILCKCMKHSISILFRQIIVNRRKRKIDIHCISMKLCYFSTKSDQC